MRRIPRRIGTLFPLALLWLGAPVLGAAQATSGRLIVTSRQTNAISIVDLASGTVAASLPAAVEPHEVAVSATGRTALVAEYGTAQAPGHAVAVLSLGATPAIVRRIELGPDVRPHDVDFVAGDSLAVAATEEIGGIIYFDAARGRVLRRQVLGLPGVHGVHTDPDRHVVYAMNNEQGIGFEVDARGGLPRKALLRPGLEGVFRHPGGRFIWMGSQMAHDLVKIDWVTFQEVDRVKAPDADVRRLWMTPDGGLLLHLHPAQRALVVRDGVTGALKQDVVLTATDGPAPTPVNLVTSGDGRFAYVTLLTGGAVAEVDLQRLAVTRLIAVPGQPDGIGWVK